MKVRPLNEKIQKADVVTVAFDVGKDKLNYYVETVFGGKHCAVEDEFANRSPVIREKLESLSKYVFEKTGMKLRVICEPTGGYERKLLLTARSLGLEVGYVNGEAVSKLKVMENNSSDKTDMKDPRVISMVDKCGKSFVIRQWPEEYRELRQLNEAYDHFRDSRKVAKCRLHHLISKLFVDLSFNSDFYYQKTGRALIELYHMDPRLITRGGKENFMEKSKDAVPRVRSATLERIWRDAESSVPVLRTSEGHMNILSEEIILTWQEFQLHERHKEIIRQELVRVYRHLRSGSLPPVPVANFVNEFTLARILGETGPLNNFSHHRQLWKYAGLNLRERSSGHYKGKTKVSHKGRNRLRVVAHMAVLPLIANGKLFAEEYKRRSAYMEPLKIQVALARKFLKAIFGIFKHQSAFQPERLALCESAFTRNTAA